MMRTPDSIETLTRLTAETLTQAESLLVQLRLCLEQNLVSDQLRSQLIVGMANTAETMVQTVELLARRSPDIRSELDRHFPRRRPTTARPVPGLSDSDPQ